MEKRDNALCLWAVLYTNYFDFQFLIFINSTNQITLKSSLAQKLKLIFKFCAVTEQINVRFWIHMEHKRWRKDRKTFARCYTIALKFWDEFNANFVLLYFSSYSYIKMWHLCLKNVKKNKAALLRLVLIFSKTFSILRNTLVGHSKKIVQ